MDTELPVGHAHEAVHHVEGLSEQSVSAELERQLAQLVAVARDLDPVAEPQYAAA
jgi:hypothetical protein